MHFTKEPNMPWASMHCHWINKFFKLTTFAMSIGKNDKTFLTSVQMSINYTSNSEHYSMQAINKHTTLHHITFPREVTTYSLPGGSFLGREFNKSKPFAYRISSLPISGDRRANANDAIEPFERSLQISLYVLLPWEISQSHNRPCNLFKKEKRNFALKI